MAKREDNVVELRVNEDTGEIQNNGSGKTLEQLAEQAAELAAEMPGFVHGSSPQLTLDIGGKKPDGSELKIKGANFPMLGQFPKNKRMKLLLDAEVETITVKTERDRDRLIVGHTRVHQAVVGGVRQDPLKDVLDLLGEHGVSKKALIADLTELLG